MLSAAACLSVTAGLAVTAFGVFLVRRRLAVVHHGGDVGDLAVRGRNNGARLGRDGTLRVAKEP